MANKSWFKFENKAGEDSTDIYVYDEIGYWGVTAKDFCDALRSVGTSNINLKINSPGGDVFDGITIHNALKQHSATVKVQVDGLAASIASIIAMAGDEIRMAQNSFMMIHRASSIVWGNEEEMTKMADTLKKIDATLVDVYKGKTNAKQADIIQMMADETWLNADEALEAGFCDCIGDPADIKAHFDLTKFRNTPQAVAAMNIRTAEPTERDHEKRLRDSGFSRQQALVMMAALKPEQRDSVMAEAEKFKAYMQTELIKTIMQ